MIKITLAIIVTTALSLAFAGTRSFGVVGIAVLLLLHPVLTSALLLLAGVALYLFKRR